MTRPDLDSDQGRAAYRGELRRVGWKLRWAGLVFIVVGAIWVLMARDAQSVLAQRTVIGAYASLACGWVLYLAAVIQRTRHHRRRLAEGL